MGWKDKIGTFKQIDVRGIQGNFFQGLKKQAMQMPAGSGLEIVQSFDPIPLYEVMEGLGFEHFTEQKGESESLQAGSTSGKIRITAETVKNLSVKSTSGVQDISTQQSDSVSAASTSGDETLHLKTVPASVDVSATSGKVSLFVPKNADFKAEVDMTSGSFDSDISLKKDGKQYTAGSGKNQMKIDTTSGNVAIKAED